MIRRTLFGVIAASVLVFSSCNQNQQSAKQKPKPKDASNGIALQVFEKRILPIFHAKRPSSCSECHLGGVQLNDYIFPEQDKTFAALVSAGLIDVDQPDSSKILEFIEREPEKPSLITAKVRKDEYDAFRAWIEAAVADPGLLSAKSNAKVGPTVPVEVVRHSREDRVLESFVDNVWSEVARCSGCHSSDQNQAQVKDHGDRVSWIKAGDPRATMQHLLEADLLDLESPEQSQLLMKPTLQVEHGGGQKMLVGDRSYRQFRRFIDDYAAMASQQYKTASDLPIADPELSVATSMTNGIWFKLTGVPEKYDKQLLQVDLFRKEGSGWSTERWATADRAVAGTAGLWQQTLSLTAPRDSKRIADIRTKLALPAGEYLVKVYIDTEGRLDKDSSAGLSERELVGEVVLDSSWPTGYGRMTVATFP
jgi:hypothetical protein